MKIAVIATFDADNIKTWSGTSFNIISKLRRKNEVDVIQISLERTWLSFVRGIWYNKILKKTYYSDYDISLLKRNAKKINSQIKKEYDLLLSFQFFFLPFIKGEKKALITDATFDNLVNYYDYMSNLSTFSINGGNEIFKKCTEENFISVFSSDWARNNAITKYKGDPKKLFTIPLGANLNYIPTDEEINKWIKAKLLSKVCNILFLGAFWERKGGNDVLDILRNLLSLGLNCKLSVVGCSPEIPKDLATKVDVIGFLSKDNESENAKLNNLLRTSHVLLLPSLAECYGCVYCEANAYGIPVIGRDTGGVGTIIKDGVNGLLMAKEENNLQLAKRWKDIFINSEIYEEMCILSKREYDQRLNYEVFCSTFMKAVEGLQ